MAKSGKNNANFSKKNLRRNQKRRLRRKKSSLKRSKRRSINYKTGGSSKQDPDKELLVKIGAMVASKKSVSEIIASLQQEDIADNLDVLEDFCETIQKITGRPDIMGSDNYHLYVQISLGLHLKLQEKYQGVAVSSAAQEEVKQIIHDAQNRLIELKLPHPATSTQSISHTPRGEMTQEELDKCIKINSPKDMKIFKNLDAQLKGKELLNRGEFTASGIVPGSAKIEEIFDNILNLKPSSGSLDAVTVLNELNNLSSELNKELTNRLEDSKTKITNINALLTILETKSKTLKAQSGTPDDKKIQFLSEKKILNKLFEILSYYGITQEQRKRANKFFATSIYGNETIIFATNNLSEETVKKLTGQYDKICISFINFTKAGDSKKPAMFDILIKSLIELFYDQPILYSKDYELLNYLKKQIFKEEDQQETIANDVIISTELLNIIFYLINKIGGKKILRQDALQTIKKCLGETISTKETISYAYINHLYEFLIKNNPQASILLNRHHHPKARDTNQVNILAHIQSSFQMFLGIPAASISDQGVNILDIDNLLELQLSRFEIAKMRSNYSHLFADTFTAVASNSTVLMPNSIMTLYPRMIHETVIYLFNYEEYEFDNGQARNPINVQVVSIIRNILKTLINAKTHHKKLTDMFTPLLSKATSVSVSKKITLPNIDEINNNIKELITTFKILLVIVMIYFYNWLKGVTSDAYINSINEYSYNQYSVYTGINSRPALRTGADATFDSLTECIDNMVRTIKDLEAILETLSNPT